jgi:hypothetical protein
MDYNVTMLEKILLFVCGFLFGLLLPKKLNSDNVKSIKRVIKGKNYGAVIEPKTEEEIRQEKNKEFYERL